MSRHRKREKTPSRPAESLPPSTAPSPPAEATKAPPAAVEAAEWAPRSRTAWRIALGIAAAWWAALILLAIFTSNPVVLNLRQIEHADYLVKARIDDLRQGRITIERDWQLHPQWVTPLKPGPLQVANLAEARGGRNGRDFLIPLSNVQGRYEVTPAAGPGTIPFIYPATPEVEREMSQALEDLKAHPLASIGRQ